MGKKNDHSSQRQIKHERSNVLSQASPEEQGRQEEQRAKGDSLDWHAQYSLRGPAVAAFTSGKLRTW